VGMSNNSIRSLFFLGCALLVAFIWWAWFGFPLEGADKWITAAATLLIGLFTFTLRQSTEKMWTASEKQFGLSKDVSDRQAIDIQNQLDLARISARAADQSAKAAIAAERARFYIIIIKHNLHEALSDIERYPNSPTMPLRFEPTKDSGRGCGHIQCRQAAAARLTQCGSKKYFIRSLCDRAENVIVLRGSESLRAIRLEANHSLKEGASMRKRNDSNPPELRPDSRLINTAVEKRKCKRPNALKHGLFSNAVLIPGEDSEQYKQLLTELIDQYKPSGPTLRDEVIELANLMWKRRRLRNFIQSQLAAAMFNPRTPAFNEAWGLTAFTYYLRTEPETCFEQHAKTYLRADKIRIFGRKISAIELSINVRLD
jgi:hypothetical protein